MVITIKKNSYELGEMKVENKRDINTHKIGTRDNRFLISNLGNW